MEQIVNKHDRLLYIVQSLSFLVIYVACPPKVGHLLYATNYVPSRLSINISPEICDLMTIAIDSTDSVLQFKVGMAWHSYLCLLIMSHKESFKR